MWKLNIYVWLYPIWTVSITLLNFLVWVEKIYKAFYLSDKLNLTVESIFYFNNF